MNKWHGESICADFIAEIARGIGFTSLCRELANFRSYVLRADNDNARQRIFPSRRSALPISPLGIAPRGYASPRDRSREKGAFHQFCEKN
jgi:hypothetical protein